MKDINKEMLAILNQIIDKVCNDEFNSSKTINKNFVFVKNEDINNSNANDSLSDTIEDSHTVIKARHEENAHKLNISRNSSGFEDFYAKSTPEEKFHSKESHFFEFETDLNRKTGEYCPKTSTPIHSENESFDETIDAAIKKYEAFQVKKELKNAFVQTMSNVVATIDSQCQCDFVQVSISESLEKKIKRRLSTNDENVSEQYEAFEEQSLGGDEAKHSNCYSAMSYSKSTSRIRLGLSKRFKPRPPQNYGFQ